MTIAINDERAKGEGAAASWGGVFAMSLGAFALIASEFMPVSLLTPIAADLQVTEGQAGQAISVSGAFAVLTSLFIAAIVGKLDRKLVLIGLTGLMALSGAIVALAPNYTIFMIGRALIGVVIGGFWSMSAATAMRLVPKEQVPRALALINGGNALATVIAAPLGSYLGGIIGWRGAFFFVVPVAIVVLAWQVLTLPSMREAAGAASKNVFKLLLKPMIASGMAAVGLFFMGQFALFTYLRPFLETATRLSISELSLVLLVVGMAGLLGTLVVGSSLKGRLFPVLTAIPLVMAFVAIALVLFGRSFAIVTVLLGLWGFLATAAPVAWQTWLARALPRDTEAGGGLMVAVIQLAITAGAVIGGGLFDVGGHGAVFVAGALMLTAASALAGVAKVRFPTKER